MSLPINTIDRLFHRLSATYGSAWNRMWEAMEIIDVKTAWAHELSGFANNLHAIAWALENLPEMPPNVIQFRALARRAPVPELPRLPEPKADPERLKAELAKLEPIRKAAKAQGDNHKDWARRIVTKHMGGLPVNSYTLWCAKEALKLGKA
ncbi:MAG: hypothetical protein E6Q97_12610 [Desulfurellales bacterium]|nr:MAG: hypothetical protein E6Q97_12610 [Desulfurellales bacterium]